MVRQNHDALPTVVANTESLRQQLWELHAAVKAQCAQRQEQGDQATGAGMVVRGK